MVLLISAVQQSSSCIRKSCANQSEEKKCRALPIIIFGSSSCEGICAVSLASLTDDTVNSANRRGAQWPPIDQSIG